MLTVRRVIGSGPDSIATTLALMARWRDYYGTLPAIRKAALLIAPPRDDNDQAQQAATLARFVKQSLVYQSDPVNSEFIQSPDLLLLEISDHGTARGDCDDHVLLFVSLAESVGIPCRIAGVMSPGAQEIDHVIAVVHLDGRDVDVDLCAKQGFDPIYSSKVFAP